MHIELDGNFWTLDEIVDVEWFMIVQLPQAADINQSEKGRKRLIPDPVENPDEEKEFVEDWNEYVVPELETQFREDVETVAADIAQAEETEGSEGESMHRLSIPADHGEIWFRVLNQARIIINEEHDVSKLEESLMMGSQNPTDMGEKGWLLMVQFRIYAGIQEFLLTEIMKG